VFFLEPLGKGFQGILTGLQIHLVALRQRADVRQLQSLIQETAESRLGEPVVKGYRRCSSGWAATQCSSSFWTMISLLSYSSRISG
jgi:hypothetical protein